MTNVTRQHTTKDLVLHMHKAPIVADNSIGIPCNVAHGNSYIKNACSIVLKLLLCMNVMFPELAQRFYQEIITASV